MNNIYLIEAEDCDYDCYKGHVVIAPTSKSARSMCPSGDEGTVTRVSPKRSKIKKIGTSSLKAQVVLSDYHSG